MPTVEELVSVSVLGLVEEVLFRFRCTDSNTSFALNQISFHSPDRRIDRNLYYTSFREGMLAVLALAWVWVLASALVLALVSALALALVLALALALVLALVLV